MGVNICLLNLTFDHWSEVLLRVKLHNARELESEHWTKTSLCKHVKIFWFVYFHTFIRSPWSFPSYKKSYNFDYKSNKNFLIYIFIFWKRIIRFSRFGHLSIPIAEGFEGERKTDNYSTWCIYYAGMKNAISTLGAINIV